MNRHPWSAVTSVAFLVVAVSVGAAGVHGAATGQSAEAALSRFETFYQAKVKDHGIVGSSIMLTHDGRVALKSFYGAANVEPRKAVDEHTIFHWASITKTLTAIGIMQLRDRGLLKLDDPIVDYIPELRRIHNPHGNVRDITIRHLLTHRAGFRNPTWPWGGSEPWHPHEPTEWAQVVAMFPYTEILFKPGSKYSYSNPGIIFLGRVIEQLTGDDYEVYIDKNVLKPLEMYRSYFDATPYHLLRDRSASYFVKDGKRTTARFDVNTGITVSNGGLNAPLGDMVKYLDFLIGHPARQAVYDGVLKRSSLEEMFKPAIDVSKSPTRNVAMGLTFFVEDQGGLRLIGHSGGQNAFISHIYTVPERRAGYVVAYNTEAVTTDKAGKGNTRVLDAEIRDYLVEHLFPALPARRSSN
jgi:CubicO group peptidase (beta-lactamase class C family)